MTASAGRLVSRRPRPALPRPHGVEGRQPPRSRGRAFRRPPLMTSACRHQTAAIDPTTVDTIASSPAGDDPEPLTTSVIHSSGQTPARAQAGVGASAPRILAGTSAHRHIHRPIFPARGDLRLPDMISAYTGGRRRSSRHREAPRRIVSSTRPPTTNRLLRRVLSGCLRPALSASAPPLCHPRPSPIGQTRKSRTGARIGCGRAACSQEWSE